MIKPYKILLSLTLALLVLSSCGGNAPIDVPDFVITGWLGAAGGDTDYCSSVHTNSTAIDPVHHTLDECLDLLNGSVIISGADFNTLVAGRDKLCVEAGSCTYEQAKAAARIRNMILQSRKVNPIQVTE